MHPLLLPGTHVLRRDDDTVQVGLHDATVLPGPARRPTALLHDPAVAAALHRRGLATADDGALRRALPPAGGDPWPRHTLAALARRAGERLPARLVTRAGHRVEVRPFGHPLAERLAGDLVALCERAGLAAGAGEGAGARGDRTDVSVLVGVGEPRRDLVDGPLRDGRPHLVVRLVEGWATVGPLVVPGRTACLRCTDAYRTEEDPSWPLLVEQYARESATDRADGVPEPVDAALAAVAVAWAARDLASYAEGTTPTSWSSTVRLSPDLGEVESRTWPIHPACGCSWG